MTQISLAYARAKVRDKTRGSVSDPVDDQIWRKVWDNCGKVGDEVHRELWLRLAIDIVVYEKIQARVTALLKEVL